MTILFQDLTIFAGETYPGPESPGSFTWTSGGTPVNLTGYTASLQMRGQNGDLYPALSISTTAGPQGSISLTAQGVISFTIPASVTGVLQFPTNQQNPLFGVYALKLTSPQSQVVTFMSGRVSVIPTPNP